MKGFAILLAIPAFLTAQDIQSRRPILALHVVVPFDVEYTSGMPVFVLYDDGLAIYRAKASSSHYPRFVSAKLEPGTVAKLRDLAIGPGFRALDGAYDLVPQLTDQSLSTIRVWSTGYAKAVTVRGYAPDSPEPFANLFLMLAIYGLSSLPFLAGGAVVSLSFARMSDRINLLYARRGATLAEIEAACRAAHMHDFIAAGPSSRAPRCSS